MKICITNAYTWYNKGDAGILLGTVETLKKIYASEQLEIRVLSFTPEEDKKRYCNDPVIKDVASNVLNPHPYKHTKLGKLIALEKLFFSVITQFFLLKFKKNKLIEKNLSYKYISESDLIVVCGGGFLGGKKFDSLMHLFQIYVDCLFNKKVVILGTSIEPLTNKFLDKLTKKVLKKVDFIYAREQITYDYLKGFIDENKMCLGPDYAFMLSEKIENVDFKIRKSSKIGYTCGITVRSWNFPGSNNPQQMMDNYLKTISEFIERKVLNDGALFYFIPQVIVNYSSDVFVAEQIKNNLSEKAKDNFIIIEEDLTPFELKSIISNFDYFVGTRMHSNIFSTSMCVPTLAIAYEKKTVGIMHVLDLDDYVLDINSINYNVICERFTLLQSNRSRIKRKLMNNIPTLKKDIVDMTFKILK